MKKCDSCDLSLLRQGNISLILDSYQDIFSDFDPRPYSQKALSDDFLNECRKASVDKAYDGLELRFLVPKKKRKIKDETEIIERLKSHFQRHFQEQERDIKKIRYEGYIWTIIGAILIFIATIIYSYEGLMYNFLVVLFEPAGWFIIWTGLEKSFLDHKEKLPLYNFYKKMAHAQISFHSC